LFIYVFVLAKLMRTLRQILKLCRPGHKLTDTDAAVVIANVLDSTACTDRQKQLAVLPTTCFLVKHVTWAGRRQKCIHMSYPGCEAGVPLTLGKLEARPAKRASTRRSTDNRDKVLAACRAIIQDQIQSYRQRFWSKYEQLCATAIAMQIDPPPFPRCPLTGKSLRHCQTHVDHSTVPFVRLVEHWLVDNGLDFEQVGSTVRKSRALGRYTLGYSELDDSWSEYHELNAKLVLVEAKANMSKGAKQ
jgi:hypothetical protein